MGRRRDPALGDSHPPAGGDAGTSGSVADKIEDVKSTNGDTRKGGATIVCRRQVSAAGDSRPQNEADSSIRMSDPLRDRQRSRNAEVHRR